MPQALDEKCEIIRKREESFAYSLAKQVIEKPEATVWLIFLPILLVFYFQRIQKFKSSIHSFVAGITHSKMLILDATMEEVKTGVFARKRVIAGFMGSIPEDKAELVRTKKIEEMEILRQHYLLLLGSNGSSYPELLRSSYGTSGDYRFFLNRFAQAEKEVNEAVLLASHPTPEAREAVAEMEKAAEKLREMESKVIFG
jgi:hypothetical protein